MSGSASFASNSIRLAPWPSWERWQTSPSTLASPPPNQIKPTLRRTEYDQPLDNQTQQRTSFTFSSLSAQPTVRFRFLVLFFQPPEYHHLPLSAYLPEPAFSLHAHPPGLSFMVDYAPPWDSLPRDPMHTAHDLPLSQVSCLFILNFSTSRLLRPYLTDMPLHASASSHDELHLASKSNGFNSTSPVEHQSVLTVHSFQVDLFYFGNLPDSLP